jgi:tetratricopeptide (TPR) repeat protein
VLAIESGVIDTSEESPAAKPAPPELPAVSLAPPPSNTSRLWGTETATVDSFDFDALPGRLSDPAIRGLWREGLALEREERLLESSELYERIVARVPEESFTYWRLARNYWRAGEALPVDATDERLGYFKKAERWAARGIAADDDCAPCMLWQFVSMGRQATTEGIWTAARNAKEMSRLLERGIELQPEHSDDAGNSVLGNLYYSGAVFYRFVPDSWWVKLLIGVRGDLDRSLEYIREAVAISEQRVDYRVELGTVLLCQGQREGDPASVREGIEVLEEARRLPPYLSTDHLDIEHAGKLIEHPEIACGYSRDGFIDMDEVVSRAKVTSRR